MLRKLSTLLMLVTFASQLSAQQAVFHKGHEYCSARKMHMQPGEQLLKKTPVSLMHSFDVLNYTMELDLLNNYNAPYPNSFSANVILEFRVD